MRGNHWTAMQNDRGEGTTTTQLQSLRRYDVFLTNAKTHAEHLIRKHGMASGIVLIHRAISGADDHYIYERLRALREEAWIEVDHSASKRIHPRLLEFIEAHNDRSKHAATTT